MKMFLNQFLWLTFSLINLVLSHPFEDQKEISFPEDMPKAQASLGSGVKGSGLNNQGIGLLEPDAGPISPDEDFGVVQLPFSEKCEKHIINYNKNDSPKHHLDAKDELAFYPMMGNDDQASQVTVVMEINNNVYKCTIEGSMVKIDICDQINFDKCNKSLNFISTKGKNYVIPQKWNYIYATLTDHKVTLNINGMSSIDFKCNATLEEMESAEWYFAAGDNSGTTKGDNSGTTKGDNSGTTKGDNSGNTNGDNSDNSTEEISTNHSQNPTWHYLAQYPCSEYKSDVMKNNPKMHTGDSADPDDGSSENVDYSLIIGIVIGCLLLLVLIGIVAVVIKKNINKSKTAVISGESVPINAAKH